MTFSGILSKRAPAPFVWPGQTSQKFGPFYQLFRGISLSQPVMHQIMCGLFKRFKHAFKCINK